MVVVANCAYTKTDEDKNDKRNAPVKTRKNTDINKYLVKIDDIKVITCLVYLGNQKHISRDFASEYIKQTSLVKRVLGICHA